MILEFHDSDECFVKLIYNSQVNKHGIGVDFFKTNQGQCWNVEITNTQFPNKKCQFGTSFTEQFNEF